MIIDFHTHLVDRDWLPDRWWVWLKAYYSRKSFLSFRSPDEMINSLFDPTARRLLETMAECEIDKSVILPLDWGLDLGEPLISIRRQHELIYEVISVNKEKLIAFVGIDPRRNDARELTEYFVDKCDFKGIKLYPAAGFDLESIETGYLLDFAKERSIPVLIHSGFSSGPFVSENGSYWHLDKICAQYPEVNFIAAHLGNGFFEQFCSIGSNKLNFHADISLMQKIAKQDMETFKLQMRRAFNEIGYQNIFFGSDWPFSEVSIPQKTFITILKQLQVDEKQSFLSQEIAHLLGKNAYRLLYSN